ncbi:sensor histidine kinase [Sporolactobacillus shoreae]|uniref:histidine kinase n=1 Tax=Sporolactobacillus shoreae TaxID=1465501 RepID=A0A4Z0GUZ5_9BACL|nr:sensor histidine kinase [Sporolactobacillus shoreae]TGB00152.1 sensor histidine kinase [Sporolactobacillus shoreae]
MFFIYRILIFGLIGYELTTSKSALTSLEVMCFLSLVIFDVLKTKYIKTRIMAHAEWLLIVILCFIHTAFFAAGGFLLPDILKEKRYKIPYIAILVAPTLFFLSLRQIFLYLLYLSVCFYLTVLMNRLEEMEGHFKKVTDEERRSIYELEKSKQLLQLQKEEGIHLAEFKERNRIARELHDTVGHRIAGLYIQLQAAYKIRMKNAEKFEALVEKTITELSSTLSLIHDTAHDLVPKRKTGLDTVRDMVDSFNYCETSFAFPENVEGITASHWRVLEANVREALTNVFKHSEATKVTIELTANQHFIRMFIHDNGRGAPVPNHHLGLSGMSERVNEMGGSLTIDGRSGFTIVCLLPRTKKEGGLFAASNR